MPAENTPAPTPEANTEQAPANDNQNVPASTENNDEAPINEDIDESILHGLMEFMNTDDELSGDTTDAPEDDYRSGITLDSDDNVADDDNSGEDDGDYDDMITELKTMSDEIDEAMGTSNEKVANITKKAVELGKNTNSINEKLQKVLGKLIKEEVDNLNQSQATDISPKKHGALDVLRKFAANLTDEDFEELVNEMGDEKITKIIKDLQNSNNNSLTEEELNESLSELTLNFIKRLGISPTKVAAVALPLLTALGAPQAQAQTMNAPEQSQVQKTGDEVMFKSGKFNIDKPISYYNSLYKHYGISGKDADMNTDGKDAISKKSDANIKDDFKNKVRSVTVNGATKSILKDLRGPNLRNQEVVKTPKDSLDLTKDTHRLEYIWKTIAENVAKYPTVQEAISASKSDIDSHMKGLGNIQVNPGNNDITFTYTYQDKDTKDGDGNSLYGKTLSYLAGKYEQSSGDKSVANQVWLVKNVNGNNVGMWVDANKVPEFVKNNGFHYEKGNLKTALDAINLLNAKTAI